VVEDPKTSCKCVRVSSREARSSVINRNLANIDVNRIWLRSTKTKEEGKGWTFIYKKIHERRSDRTKILDGDGPVEPQIDVHKQTRARINEAKRLSQVVDVFGWIGVFCGKWIGWRMLRESDAVWQALLKLLEGAREKLHPHIRSVLEKNTGGVPIPEFLFTSSGTSL
jgi:hypothetical protein